MLRVAVVVLLIAAVAVGIVLLRPGPEPEKPEVPSRFVVLDPAGRPVAGARVAQYMVSEYFLESWPAGRVLTREDGGAPIVPIPDIEPDASLTVLVRCRVRT